MSLYVFLGWKLFHTCPLGSFHEIRFVCQVFKICQSKSHHRLSGQVERCFSGTSNHTLPTTQVPEVRTEIRDSNRNLASRCRKIRQQEARLSKIVRLIGTEPKNF